MTSEEYVKLVCQVLNNDNGKLLIKHLTEQIDLKMRDFEVSWKTVPIDDRALYSEIGKFNLLKAFESIIASPSSQVAIDVDKFNEEQDNV